MALWSSNICWKLMQINKTLIILKQIKIKLFSGLSKYFSCDNFVYSVILAFNNIFFIVY